MNCPVFDEEKINKYIDNELNTEQQSEFKKHIEICGYCKNYIDEFKSAVSILKSHCEINVPPRMWYKIKDKFVKRRRYRLIGRVGFAGVCMGVLLFFAFTVNLRNRKIQEISIHIAEQIDFFHYMDTWYLYYETGESVIDLFLLGEL